MAQKRMRTAASDLHRRSLLIAIGRDSALCARARSDYLAADVRVGRWRDIALCPDYPARIKHEPMLLKLGQTEADARAADERWRQARSQLSASFEALRLHDIKYPSSPAGA